ncbi:hypothetical protein DXF96_08495 [Heyndrickxia coagulans]|uniref:hypothetical protein n=1 Tax=Heyndrickxia coagulans TaxID=1398 RepID=UPI000D737D3F|nr:hypothetical protein [Heyndrickxia coagulans]AWP36012.1 hypothetical protein CYJ15_02935 [Heyndrickxia coagulans]QDI61511.1 hypothetical protein DXF96_08495 [Heyndrickxia coagulans]
MEVRLPGVDGKEVVLDLPNYYYDLGYKKGFKEGFKEGVKERREEERTRLIINLLKNQVDVKAIVQASGLSEDEIMKINRENNW